MATAAAKKKSTGMKEEPDQQSPLVFAMRMLEKMLGGSPQDMFLTPTKTKTIVSMSNFEATVEAVLPTSIDGLDSPCKFPFKVLMLAIANRKDLEFSVADGTLFVKGGSRYKAQIVGSEASECPRVSMPKEVLSEFTVNSEASLTLKEGLRRAHIEKSLAALPDLTVHLSFKKKAAVVTTFDRSQMAAYHAENTSGEMFEVTLPLRLAESIFKDYLGETTVRVTENAVFTQVNGFKMSSLLPAAEDSNGVPIERVLEKIASLRKADLESSVLLKRSDFLDFLNNAKALSKSSALLKFEIGKSKAKLILEADGNKIEASIPAKADSDFEFLLDIAYVHTIAEKSKDDINLQLDESMMVLKSEDFLYAAVLSTPAEVEGAKSKKTSTKDYQQDD